ncbi:hypothetical protein LINGRAHAP2_LOCUS35433 [Linum grandiflorum]
MDLSRPLRMGFRRVVLQMDSRCAVSLLTTVTNDDHQHASLVARFKELQARNWDIHIEHIFQEANNATDHLAHLGHSFPLGVHVITAPSADILNWVLHDQLSSS